MIKRARIAVGGLAVSAALLVALVQDEGYTDTAVIPVVGDRPTVGYGSTFREDGSPVKIGDTTTPVKALARTLSHIQKDERGIKSCVTAPLTQAEYDLMVDFSYQYGTQTLCKSSIVRQANTGNYLESCKAYLSYRFVAGYDCSTMINGKPNKRCWGVWERSQDRYSKCVEGLS